MKGIKVDRTDKAYLGFEGSEILGIEWITFVGNINSITFERPHLYCHIRLKNGKEKYVPLHEKTSYLITCKENNIFTAFTMSIH